MRKVLSDDRLWAIVFVMAATIMADHLRLRILFGPHGSIAAQIVSYSILSVVMAATAMPCWRALRRWSTSLEARE